MHIQYLIIGQGISGTFLSWFLHQQSASFLVIDDNNSNAPSRLTGGVINPVTGRRLVTVWLADRVLEESWQAYQAIGHQLNITAISQKNIIDFFPNPFMKDSFEKKLNTDDLYTSIPPNQLEYSNHFHYDFGYGMIKPVYTAHLDALLPAWRQTLTTQRQLREESFDLKDLKIDRDKVYYKDIIAEKIIFCDGPASFDNPYFNRLPFAANKGEAMTVEIEGLPTDHVFKKGMLLVPLQQKDHYWIGSSYEWEFNDTNPSDNFYRTTTTLLKNWLKMDFKVVEHRAGLRPATLERRPFAGTHPLHPQIAILNGMGTKGCSLAPVFANELCNHLLNGSALHPAADINRFIKVLSR